MTLKAVEMFLYIPSTSFLLYAIAYIMAYPQGNHNKAVLVYTTHRTIVHLVPKGFYLVMGF